MAPMHPRLALIYTALCLVCSCGGRDTSPANFELTRRVDSEKSALLAVHGTGRDNVWAVGADDGTGPVVLHWDGHAWSKLETGLRGDLWWVHALPGHVTWMAGSDAHWLRIDDGDVERLATPGLGRHTIFGLWANGQRDVYAVGAEAGRNGFIWHYDGQRVRNLELPADLLPKNADNDTPGLFKVWGSDDGTVWIAGDRGVILHGNAVDGFERLSDTPETTYFTVAGRADRAVFVGGTNRGVLLEATSDALKPRIGDDTPLLQGAFIGPADEIWATGQAGAVLRLAPGADGPTRHDVTLAANHSLHAIWVSPQGDVWTVGGNVLSAELDNGGLWTTAPDIAELTVDPTPKLEVTRCPDTQVDSARHGSMARRWNEQLLWAVRRDIPRPTVHARNLYHLSLAMWDAYAAYQPEMRGVIYHASPTATGDAGAPERTIAYAAYELLKHRYGEAQGGSTSRLCFDALMDKLALDRDGAADGWTPERRLGVQIASSIIKRFANDGANEANNYADPDGYAPEEPNLVVDLPGTKSVRPTSWQQIVLAEAETQNGIPEGSGVRAYIGAHWGQVEAFALPPGAATKGGLVDIGRAPSMLDDDLADAALQVIEKSAELDIEDGETIDISPGAYGNNSDGTDDGTGHGQNPVTGAAYTPQKVLRGDFTRVMAEFWADGPTSETPPGHWNTLANQVTDAPSFSRRLFGEGPELSALAYDVHLYLALNGALHDAAIAAWGLKRAYLTARPITLIRYMGARGQRSDSNGPAYDPDGLPLADGLVEVITEASSAAGQRHAHLRRYAGEIAVRAFRGEPGDRATEVGGIGWVRAVDWIPYQRRTFVTPAFPGYVSGHSTFSRAGAEVLAALTGSPFFPGGIGRHRVAPGYLVFEYGPTEAFELQWATYVDAADQAGQSRLWGGIHVRHDDYDGRLIGAQVGRMAVEHARSLFSEIPVP